MTYLEYIDFIAPQLDSGDFEPIFRIATVPTEYMVQLVHDMYQEGIDVEELVDSIPAAKTAIKEMKEYLEVTNSFYNQSPWNGCQLDWMLEGTGAWEYKALYIAYFELNKEYRIEKLDTNYCYWVDGKDYYICEVKRWDLENFKKHVDEEDY